MQLPENYVMVSLSLLLRKKIHVYGDLTSNFNSVCNSSKFHYNLDSHLVSLSIYQLSILLEVSGVILPGKKAIFK